ncbi:hypothetical protein ACFVTT_23510 [Streptomyces niveus]
MTTFLIALSATGTWWGLGLLVVRVAAEGHAHPAVTLLRRHGGRHAR